MTLKEAIRHAEDKGKGDDDCAQEHRQLAAWLKELMFYHTFFGPIPAGLVEKDSVGPDGSE